MNYEMGGTILSKTVKEKCSMTMSELLSSKPKSSYLVILHWHTGFTLPRDAGDCIRFGHLDPMFTR